MSEATEDMRCEFSVGGVCGNETEYCFLSFSLSFSILEGVILTRVQHFHKKFL